jgi:hypothetical protein
VGRVETAAIIIIGVAGLVAAGLGLGVGLAARRWANLAFPAYWFAIAGAILGIAASAGVIGGWGSGLFAGERIAVDEVLPYMGAIKGREPALYERIETSVIRDQQDGLSAETVRANAKALVSSYVADKVARLPDDLTYELYATMRDMLAYLDERADHATCADFALGRFKGDIDAALSPDLVERNKNNTLRAISAEPVDDAHKMPAEEFAQLAATAFAQASQVTGIPPEEVDVLLSGEGDPPKTCKLMKAFFDSVLAQPVDVAAAALRTLASGELSGI